jgi:hypothetical protein
LFDFVGGAGGSFVTFASWSAWNVKALREVKAVGWHSIHSPLQRSQLSTNGLVHGDADALQL